MNTIPEHLLDVTYGAYPKGVNDTEWLTLPPQLVVMHRTGNTASARAEAHYAATREDPRSHWTSAHFYVDDNEIIGSVPLNRRAWAAFHNGNMRGWHIEICGNANTEFGLPRDRLAAQLTRYLVDLGGMPIRRVFGFAPLHTGVRGIAGHADITAGFPEDHGTHTDPWWNGVQWDHFLLWVRQSKGLTPVPTTSTGDEIMTKLPTLSRAKNGGHISQQVKNAQALLNGHGATLVVDGDFGGKTELALTVFQRARKITADGILGPVSWANLLDV